MKYLWQCGHSRRTVTSIWMLEGSYLGLFTEWGFSHMPVWKPEAKWRREKQEDGIVEKDSQKVKEQRKTSSTRDRLTDWNANIVRRKKEGDWQRRIQDTCHLFECWIAYCVVMCSVYFPSEFKKLSVVNNCFSFVSQNISFGVEYSNTGVKLTENRNRTRPAFNT